MKKTVLFLLIASIGLVACQEDSREVDVTQDVYKTVEECVSDWGSMEYCTPDPATAPTSSNMVNASAPSQPAPDQGTGSSSGFMPFVTGMAAGHLMGQVMGPTYERGSRQIVTSSGSRYSPASNRSFSSSNYKAVVGPNQNLSKVTTANKVTPTNRASSVTRSSNASSSSRSSGSISRGGFSSGRSSGGSFGG